MPKDILVKKTIFRFEELSEKVRAKLANDNGEFYTSIDSEQEASLMEFQRIFDIKIYAWEVGAFSLPTYRIDYSHYSEEDLNLDGINAWDFVYLNIIPLFKQTKYTSKTELITSCPFTGVYFDESFVDSLRKFYDSKNEENLTVQGLFRKMIDIFFSDWTSNMEYYFSEEFTKEDSDANDYWYYADGEIADESDVENSYKYQEVKNEN